MSNQTALSINTLLNKMLMAMNVASTDIASKNLAAKESDNANNLDIDHGIEVEAVEEKCLTVTEKMLSYNPLATCQTHTLHHAMKGLGYLPTPVLDSLVSYLKGPTSKQYLHADAHLRLILAVNSKLKTPLDLIPMQELRARFAADAVAMQSPHAWQQASHRMLSNLTRFVKKGDAPIHWEDKIIANADDGDMTLRCYQTDRGAYGLSTEKQLPHNPDQTVMLFFHGGGFCIGDVDTHHEFCRAVCKQTGWPVVSVDYRLAPEHPAPAALKDCITAYAWLAEHCQSFGVLPSRIVLAGDSAGGGLSTLITQQLTAPHEDAWQDLGRSGQDMYHLLTRLPTPLAQMPLYPVTDIEKDYRSWELYGEGLLLDHADVAVFDAACLDNSPLPRQHVLNCPMLGDNSQACPTYMVASELDVLRDEAFAYTKQLKAHGIAVETHTVLGAPHGFIHFMSVHQGLGQQTSHIIDGFAGFVRQLIHTQSQLAA